MDNAEAETTTDADGTDRDRCQVQGRVMHPLVLDACCGGRSFWMNPEDERALFIDNRQGTWPVNRPGRSPIIVAPDVVADFTEMPFSDATFYLVVFDPPHFTEPRAGRGTIRNTYGCLFPGWEQMLAAGFKECFRVLAQYGTLVFKWCSVEIPLRDVLALTDQKPLFGHRSGKLARTHWVTFLKSDA